MVTSETVANLVEWIKSDGPLPLTWEGDTNRYTVKFLDGSEKIYKLKPCNQKCNSKPWIDQINVHTKMFEVYGLKCSSSTLADSYLLVNEGDDKDRFVIKLPILYVPNTETQLSVLQQFNIFALVKESLQREYFINERAPDLFQPQEQGAGMPGHLTASF